MAWLRILALLVIAYASWSVALGAQRAGSASAQAASELTRLLGEHRLDAVAARDPEQPDRFIAALFYPGAQLLVISATYPVPQQLQQRLDARQFRDVYLDLHGAGLAEGKVFITDLGADGLDRARKKGEPFDVVYVDGAQHMAYDGDWSDQKITESDYARRFEADDARYARMLQALVTALRPAATVP